MIHLARGDGLPGDKSYLRKGCETHAYNVVATMCKQAKFIGSIKQRRRDSNWATATLRMLWKTRDPNFAVRLSLSSTGMWNCTHAFQLLSLKYCDLEAWSHSRRRDKVFVDFARRTTVDMCRAGLRLSTVLHLRQPLASPLVRIVAACVIQKTWRTVRRRRAATTVQAAWRSHRFRRDVLHNPYTVLGHRWLVRQARQHVSIHI